MSGVIAGAVVGFLAWFSLRYVLIGFYTVNQNERAVKTSFGRAERLGERTTHNDPTLLEYLPEKDRERYIYPLVRVIQPGGPYFRWPWERVYKVRVDTQTMNMAQDLENPAANQNGTVLEAVTKDQLNVGLTGQIRFRASERNIYAYLFGVKSPVVHVMGYFVALLRERIANFEAPNSDDEQIANLADGALGGISINDLRKNLSMVNDYMEQECLSAESRYGIVLDASLITGIDPPQEVDSALAAINTAHNQVSSDISLAQASADQKIVQSRRAVEIETFKAEAEVEPLVQLAAQLRVLKENGGTALQTYIRNVKLRLYKQAHTVILEEKK